MFRRGVRRFTLGALLVVSVAALTAATGGSAGVGFVSAVPYSSQDGNGIACPGFSVNERHYCLVVTTYSNLKLGGAVEADLTIQNFDQSALTNPSATLTWDNSLAKLSFLAADPANCSSSTGSVTCSFPNIPGVGSISGPGVTPNTSTVKLYFGSAADSATTIHFTGTASAKESGNDSGGAANVETQTVPDAAMTFDTNTGDGANEDATVVLPSAPFNKPHLHTTLGNAFLDFTSGSPAFIAQFAATTGAQCVLGVSCTGLDLNTDLSGAAGGTFSSTNQILWTADVASTNTNIVAVHTYDPVTITPSPPNTLTTAGTRFASCDGVVFTSFGSNPQGNLALGTAYFVRNATTSGGNTSFQVSATAKGSLINVTGTGSFSGSCIRIIGDKPSEVTKACTTGSPPAMPATPPVLCAAKLNTTTVRAYLWDDANGHLGY
jgi:hypothetical protein